MLLLISSVAKQNFCEGPNLLTLSEQLYLVWAPASWTTKRQDLLALEGHGRFGRHGYAYVFNHS